MNPDVELRTLLASASKTWKRMDILLSHSPILSRQVAVSDPSGGRAERNPHGLCAGQAGERKLAWYTEFWAAKGRCREPCTWFILKRSNGPFHPSPLKIEASA